MRRFIEIFVAVVLVGIVAFLIYNVLSADATNQVSPPVQVVEHYVFTEVAEVPLEAEVPQPPTEVPPTAVPVVPTATAGVVEQNPAPVTVVDQNNTQPVQESPANAANDSTIAQSPVGGVGNQISDIRALGDVAIHIYGGDASGVANAETNAEVAVTQEQELAANYGTSLAVMPVQLLADASNNCQTARPDQYVVVDQGDDGIHATINQGTILFDSNGNQYEAPQICNVGKSAVLDCKERIDPRDGVKKFFMRLAEKVFGVEVYAEPLLGICPTGSN